MFDIIQAAGWPIVFLLIASVLAVALILERLLVLRRSKVIPLKLLEEVLTHLKRHGASPEYIGRLESHSHLGRILAVTVRHIHKPRSVAQEAVEDVGRMVSYELERFLTTLGTIASVAPLLGLLGTIVGMIEIFGAQAAATTTPQLLAHGISVALYNTCFGLIVAIPALIFYRYFRQRVHGFLLVMEQQSRYLMESMNERQV